MSRSTEPTFEVITVMVDETNTILVDVGSIHPLAAEAMLIGALAALRSMTLTARITAGSRLLWAGNLEADETEEVDDE